jgi:peptidoglycan hydrolase-like protein with peptidoglycan-binding domain
MHKIFAGGFLAAMLVLAWNVYAVTPAKKAPAKKTATKGKAPAKRAPATTWRNRQMAPTPDRYREIQAALAAKGYLKPEEATGAWGASSVDALKHFQADQKIESSGKINSLSLIALGLGPKRDTAVVVPPPEQSAR